MLNDQHFIDFSIALQKFTEKMTKDDSMLLMLRNRKTGALITEQYGEIAELAVVFTKMAMTQMDPQHIGKLLHFRKHVIALAMLMLIERPDKDEWAKFKATVDSMR